MESSDGGGQLLVAGRFNPHRGATADGLEQPFLHSDVEPHIPVYRIAVVAPIPLRQRAGRAGGDEEPGAGGLLVSVGKDRLLRLWDLRSGTIARCLPAGNSDAAVACCCFSSLLPLPPQETTGSAGSNVLVGGVLAIAGSDGGSGPCMWSSGIVG